MNDTCKVSELSYTIMYAEDTNVIMSGNDLKKLNSICGFRIMCTDTWLKENKFSLNVNKTFHLLFHRARIKVYHDTSIDEY